MSEIITELVRPPIPSTQFDWAAVREGCEPGDLVGTGPTEQAAIQDLLDQENVL